MTSTQPPPHAVTLRLRLFILCSSSFLPAPHRTTPHVFLFLVLSSSYIYIRTSTPIIRTHHISLSPRYIYDTLPCALFEVRGNPTSIKTIIAFYFCSVVKFEYEYEYVAERGWAGQERRAGEAGGRGTLLGPNFSKTILSWSLVLVPEKELYGVLELDRASAGGVGVPSSTTSLNLKPTTHMYGAAAINSRPTTPE
ncbi:hypothetical protein CVT25_013021 [Psilocybe cyanescens]|uniref:Uncharacterized protein n=1 Tax=Psilocybe cyanescens TaxID=93625 RepID=A0A409XLS3_PSICY|nr:hypothetical protein CVT25_013021 [Psilocybe cyanescens]